MLAYLLFLVLFYIVVVAGVTLLARIERPVSLSRALLEPFRRWTGLDKSRRDRNQR